MSRIGLFTFGLFTSNTARRDVLKFFQNCLHSTSGLYERASGLMLSKGIYDRPPKIPYAEKVEYIESQGFLRGWLGERKSINAMELSEIFFIIERNYFGVLLLQGFAQVAKDKQVKQYFLRGKEIAEKQIEIINKV